MEPSTDETRSLRRCVRELAALSVLSAAWGRTGPQGIADSLAEVLLRSLPQVDFVCARVKGLPDGVVLEAVRASQPLDPPSRLQEVGKALGRLLKGGNSDSSQIISNPVGEGEVRLAVIPIGYEGDCGVLVAGSRQPDFPGLTDQLLLGVAANQAAVVLQHQRSEEALRGQSALLHAERELWRVTLASIGDAVVTTDTQERVRFLNPVAESLTGWTAAEATGRPLSQVFRIINEQTRHPVENPALRALKEGVVVGLANHTVLIARDGTERPIDDSAAPIKDADGATIGVVLIFRDVTEQRRAEEQLREADRRKDEFLAMLAHELRNPLAPVRNAVQILRAKGPPVPELQWAREVIDRQVKQMTRLVDDLLDVSRIAKGKIELRKERIELAAVMNSAVEASRPLIEKWGHELTVTMPPEPVHLEADPTRLAQVLLNLLNNAAKYTDQGGHIWLTAQREGEQVLIRVRDNGIGIPAAMLPRVFEMFTQVDRTLERSQGGLGIGLTLVQRLVEMHGGSVEPHSDGPGRGSEFVVRLPIAVERKGQGKEGAAGEGEQTAAAPRCRILVVDDNKDAADSLGMLLRMMGNEVHTAYDGLEAVGAAAALHPDVALLDIGLPKLNGYEAARRIREQRGEEMVLIALTGWGQEEDRRRSKEAGFNHHMTKPVEFEALMKLLAALRPSSP